MKRVFAGIAVFVALVISSTAFASRPKPSLPGGGGDVPYPCSLTQNAYQTAWYNGHYYGCVYDSAVGWYWMLIS